MVVFSIFVNKTLKNTGYLPSHTYPDTYIWLGQFGDNPVKK